MPCGFFPVEFNKGKPFLKGTVGIEFFPPHHSVEFGKGGGGNTHFKFVEGLRVGLSGNGINTEGGTNQRPCVNDDPFIEVHGQAG